MKGAIPHLHKTIHLKRKEHMWALRSFPINSSINQLSYTSYIDLITYLNNVDFANTIFIFLIFRAKLKRLR